MTRQTKPRRTPRRLTVKQTPRRSGVVGGLFVGLVLGASLAAGSAWYFTRNSPFQSPHRVVAPIGAEPLALPGKPGDEPVVNRDFDFYTILPRGDEAAAVAPPAAGQPGGATAPPPMPVERLYLQVGAFEDPSEADNMKALLALNGVEAVAQRTRLDDGRIVHRVRVGPFARPEDMASVRARLNAAGVSGVVVQGN
jgi:cell division protein FtsN